MLRTSVFGILSCHLTWAIRRKHLSPVSGYISSGPAWQRVGDTRPTFHIHTVTLLGRLLCTPRPSCLVLSHDHPKMIIPQALGESPKCDKTDKAERTRPWQPSARLISAPPPCRERGANIAPCSQVCLRSCKCHFQSVLILGVEGVHLSPCIQHPLLYFSPTRSHSSFSWAYAIVERGRRLLRRISFLGGSVWSLSDVVSGMHNRSQWVNGDNTRSGSTDVHRRYLHCNTWQGTLISRWDTCLITSIILHCKCVCVRRLRFIVE